MWRLEVLYSRLYKLFVAESLRACLSIVGPDGTETTYTGDVDSISLTSGATRQQPANLSF